MMFNGKTAKFTGKTLKSIQEGMSVGLELKDIMEDYFRKDFSSHAQFFEELEKQVDLFGHAVTAVEFSLTVAEGDVYGTVTGGLEIIITLAGGSGSVSMYICGESLLCPKRAIEACSTAFTVANMNSFIRAINTIPDSLTQYDINRMHLNNPDSIAVWREINHKNREKIKDYVPKNYSL